MYTVDMDQQDRKNSVHWELCALGTNKNHIDGSTDQVELLDEYILFDGILLVYTTPPFPMNIY